MPLGFAWDSRLCRSSAEGTSCTAAAACQVPLRHHRRTCNSKSLTSRCCGRPDRPAREMQVSSSPAPGQASQAVRQSTRQRQPFPESRDLCALFQAGVTSSSLPLSLPTSARCQSGRSPCRDTGRSAYLFSGLQPGSQSSRGARSTALPGHGNGRRDYANGGNGSAGA